MIKKWLRYQIRKFRIMKIKRSEYRNKKLFEDFGLDYDDVNLRTIVKNDIWK